MNTKSTEIDPIFERGNDRDFSKGMVIYWISAFLLGAGISVVMFYLLLSLIDKL